MIENEKLAICYICCGPTYRKSALDKLTNFYYDHPNLYYCVLMDDRSYFKDLKRENLVVNELKDFYGEFPHLEEYESFLESEHAEDYGKKFLETNYKFPFSTMRFHLLQAEKFGVANVAMLGTDSTIQLDVLTDEHLQKKNTLYNTVSIWQANISEEKIKISADIIKERHGLTVSDDVLVYDTATRLFVLEDVEYMRSVFDIWNDVVTTVYVENKIGYYVGWVAINDEYIMAPIYDVMGIKGVENQGLNSQLFDVRHNPQEERFWAC